MAAMLLAAEVWHYWVGVAVAAATILTVLALVVGYFVKVVAPQYPKRSQR
jgi:hypothetical protein